MNQDKSYIQIQTTFETRESAVDFASLIVDSGLVACAQITECESIYYYEGKRFKHMEYIVKMKTTAGHFHMCEEFIKQNHPYKVPEIIALPIVSGSSEYLSWISENTKRED
ncbi:MAG: divalent-cation tolerance protein CutA [Firmicutes bacterium]|nr:divalent-cation tolerance protein CutA [Bacillota bacterium]